MKQGRWTWNDSECLSWQARARPRRSVCPHCHGRPLRGSPVIYCEIAMDSMWRAGEWVLLIREAFLLHGALFLSQRVRTKSVCTLPVPHALAEATGSSVCALSDALGGWRGCKWGDNREELASGPEFCRSSCGGDLSSGSRVLVRACRWLNCFFLTFKIYAAYREQPEKKTHYKYCTDIYVFSVMCYGCSFHILGANLHRRRHVDLPLPVFDFFFFKCLKNFLIIDLLSLLISQSLKAEAQSSVTGGIKCWTNYCQGDKGQANNWECKSPAYGGDVQGES